MQKAKHNTPTPTSQLVKRCAICGDIGFEELIATCFKCGIASQHIYCMATSNGEVPEEVPKDWMCEACRCVPDEDICNRIGKENFQNSFNAVHYDEVRQGGPTKVSVHSRRPIHSVKTGKVKFLSMEEVIKLSSGPFDMESPSKSDSGNRHHYSSVTPKFSPPKLKRNPSYISFSPTKFPGFRGIPSSSKTSQQPQRAQTEQKATITSSEKNQSCKDTGRLVKEHSFKDNIDPAKKICSKEQNITPVKSAEEVETCKFDGIRKEKKNQSATLSSKEVKACNMNAEEAVNKSSMSARHLPTIRSDSCPLAESKKPDVEGSDLLANLPKLSLYRPHFPALCVIWKGGFKVVDTATPGKFYGGFQAQPPSEVSRIAYEFAQKMPIVLQIELLRQENIWADLFQNDYPDFRDIALYFLPSENIERSKDNHASLFELMEIRNSVLSSCNNGVELLIFTSKQLDGDSQDVVERLDMKQFLWGVFRRARRDQFPPEHDCASVECSDIIDLEIDMVGGQPQGSVDKIVSRESTTKVCGDSDKKGRDQDAMSNEINDIVSTTIQQMCLESELAQQNMLSLFSGVYQKVSSNKLAPTCLTQSPLEKTSYAANEADIAPGFEEVFRQKIRNMSCEAKLKEEHVLNDGRVEHLVGKDVDLQRVTVGNPQSCTMEVKTEVVKLEYDYQDFRQRLSTKSPGETFKLSRWSPPPTNWVKLNVAGISKGNPGLAGASGVIRDASGKWLQGYSINLGNQTSLGAELWALFRGLMLAWNGGYKKVVVESASAVAVQYLKRNPGPLDPNRSLAECCMNLVNRDWVCQVLLVDRDANLSASWLAARFADHALGLTVLSRPPIGLVPILENDSMNLPCHSSRQS